MLIDSSLPDWSCISYTDKYRFNSRDDVISWYLWQVYPETSEHWRKSKWVISSQPLKSAYMTNDNTVKIKLTQFTFLSCKWCGLDFQLLCFSLFFSFVEYNEETIHIYERQREKIGTISWRNEQICTFLPINTIILGVLDEATIFGWKPLRLTMLMSFWKRNKKETSVCDGLAAPILHLFGFDEDQKISVRPLWHLFKPWNLFTDI